MLTVLSFGGGQDSTYILYKIALDKSFRQRFVSGKLIVIMSDTGDEHESTYQHIEFIISFCKRYNIEFHFIKSDMGFHPKSWPDLIGWMKKNNGLLSKVFPKSCTDNLKIKPIYNFLDNYIGKEFYSQDIAPNESRKGFIKKYASEFGKIRILLGIAKGEESRIGNKLPYRWMNDSLERIYPLIEIGADRQVC